MLTHYPHSLKRSQYGFSLVEMLIVVALVALLVAMVTPSFAKVQRTTKVTSASGQVYNAITKARQVAMRKGHPVLIKVNITATNLSMIACLDADNAASNGTPGASTNNFACDGGDLGFNVVGGLTTADNPFGGTAQMDVNNATIAQNNVSLGYPALTGGTFNAGASNLGAAGATGTFWFGFNTAGKLIPDGPSINSGATPIYSSDITALTGYPSVIGGNTVGPEFYFAEYNAAANNARPGGHVYRKVSITPVGGARVSSWRFVSSGNGYWEGVK